MVFQKLLPNLEVLPWHNVLVAYQGDRIDVLISWNERKNKKGELINKLFSYVLVQYYFTDICQNLYLLHNNKALTSSNIENNLKNAMKNIEK